MSAGHCRSCGSARLDSFYRAPDVPVHSCLMVSTREAALAFPRGEIDLQVCHACGFVQNGAYDETLQNYSPDYEETQAFSPRFLRFLDELCDDLAARMDLDGKTLLEIGCGKGEFLVALVERLPNARGVGIDPGYRPERTASPAAERLEFIQDIYREAHAAIEADFVSCRHTLEHIGEVRAFMERVRRSVGPRPQADVFFELPDLDRVLEEGAFWDIYYEHCSYFSAGSLARLFRATGFDVTRLWRAYDDQYLMLEARPAEGPTAPRLPEEDDLDATLARVEAFRRTVAARLDRLRADFGRWKDEGRTVALWGSGSKAVSLLTTLGLGEEVAAVADINPHKHGRFLAGAGHEIVSPERLAELRPDVVVIMNPIYRDEIAADLARLGIRAQVEAV